ncbi:MAG: nuclear transport factor 2 family protein [Sphingomicrobium sp.]
MITSLLLALVAAAPETKLPPAQALPPPAAEEQAVLAPINQLFAALEAGDSAGVLRIVYPEGRVTAVGTLRTGNGLRQESWTQFAARLKPGEGFRESITDPAIEVDGDIAMVWAPFVVRVGGKVSNCGVDHFDLVRENGAWRVMNITFSSRTTGCPAE